MTLFQTKVKQFTRYQFTLPVKKTIISLSFISNLTLICYNTLTFYYLSFLILDMNIKNKTKKNLLAKNAKICKNIFLKGLGLMFSRKQKAIIFIFKKEKKVPLHMLFVFYPIDVLFLDKNKNVAEKKENFKPFTFYSPKNKSKYVIELPKDAIRKTKTVLGDKIEF